MSSLAWIDYDEAERQRAQRIMALFRERESRDELGLGAIRDSIADHLFPGTNTLQTRLRYTLFIPWLFQMLEDWDDSEEQLRAGARELEVQLIDALKAGGEETGVIGQQAGDRLQQMPSAIYWSALGAWGIRTFSGSIDSLFTCLRDPRRFRLDIAAEDGEAVPGSGIIWSEYLPNSPDDLLECASFRMNLDEAQFIVDRLMRHQPDSLFTRLARDRIDAECDYVWEHPHFSDFSLGAQRLVRHAQVFSHVMQGAALLYNLALSEMREHDEWTDKYRRRMGTWIGEIDLSEIREWSLEEFWYVVQHPAHGIRPAAQRFVAEWRDLVVSQGGEIESPAARRLVEERERRLKTSQSRYANQAVRDRWNGASGVARLNFRWSQAKSHLRDIAHAE